jgi:hypothetical protein
VLRGSRDFRNLFCIDTQGGGANGGGYENVLISASIGYWGELQIICIPKGSVWEITLSDVPYKAAPVNWLDALTKRVSDQREALLATR